MERKTLFFKEVVGWIISILSAVIIALCIRSYAFASTEVRQTSMQNTLLEGQRVIEYKIGYYFSKPQRNDIVIINRSAGKGVLGVLVSNTKDFIENFSKSSTIPPEDKRLIKRVIGLPGDNIDIKDEKVFINGKAITEPYAKGNTFDNGMKFPMKIPEKMYFVMGDNREVSMDSRVLGLMDIKSIEGKAIFRVWPLNKFGGL